ncbi:hypothetical protein EON79_10810 [bacterium]|nr:MAG: hypothetical protein EON79_10810 [bacterium]
MVAIVPAAGRGVRMTVVTRGLAKELLPLGSRAVLDRVIEEAAASGARQIILVSSPNKPEIAARYGNFPGITIAIQEEPMGLGHAIAVGLRAAPSPPSRAMILLGDTVYAGGSPLGRLTTIGFDGAIAVEPVDADQVSEYGIVALSVQGDRITDIIEKPKPEDAPSRIAIAARYVFSERILERIALTATRHERGGTGELGLTGILRAALANHKTILRPVTLLHNERRVDCGSPEEYRAAAELFWD